MSNIVTSIDLGSNSFRVLKYDCISNKSLAEFETTVGTAEVKQRREYKLLNKYAERVAFLEKNIDAPVQYGIDNAKKLVSAKKMLESSYNAYAEKYGYTLGQDELADLTDDEKTLYFSTGKRPDRHSPAV